jgi:hypothetical protein
LGASTLRAHGEGLAQGSRGERKRLSGEWLRGEREAERTGTDGYADLNFQMI